MTSEIPLLSFYPPSQTEEIKKFSSVFENFQKISEKNSNSLEESVRLQRQQSWLRCTLAEYFQTATTKEICDHWSKTADEILNQVCSEIFQNTQGKIALFAYGKLGSSELNLSSDIDLVFICESDQENHVGSLRRFQKVVQESTDYGFCFRTDFDLRPGGRMGPLIPTRDQFEDYYGNYGEAWERLAFVRLRPIWGDPDLQKSVMTFVDKFAFRKHLDYSLLSDLKTLRQKIHSQYSHRTTETQLDLKLGLGGIRDLELFIHALQVVHGGKDLEMRQKKTSDAFDKIEKNNVIPSSDIQFLRQHYWRLRHLENLVQAEMDQQTHILPQSFSLLKKNTSLFSELKNDMLKCDQIVSSLLGKVDLQTKTVPASLNEQEEWLQGLGYSKDAIAAVWVPLFQQTVLSRQKERDESFRQRFLYLFLHELSRFPESQNRSLYLLQDFIKATRAKATFYSLFLNQESLIPQIARIFATSPYLAGLLCSRPELIDSFIFKTHSAVISDDPATFLETLGERKLLSELVNGSEFLNNLDLSSLTQRISEVADSITQDLLESIDSKGQLQIVPLGKWGGQELGLRSDLDFIFLTEDDASEECLRVARRFFNRLTETHQRGGSLYSIDLRLKPSGKGGLVVTSKKQLLEYLSTSADAWERQAYLRSRPKDSQLRKEIVSACLHRPLNQTDIQELARIRKELQKNSQSSSEKFDLKYGVGGLVDVEFAAQIAFLKSGEMPTSSATLHQLNQLGWNDLREGYSFMRLVEQLQQAVSVISTSTLEMSSEGFIFISNLLHLKPVELAHRLSEISRRQIDLLKHLDPRQAP